MSLAQAIRYVMKNWRPTMSAPGYWDRPAALKLLNESRATYKQLLEAKRQVKELGARLKSQAMKLEKTVTNADPQRSP
jgi:hypothetical protein